MAEAVRRGIVLILLTLGAGFSSHVRGQNSAERLTLSRLSLETTAKLLKWREPTEPMRVIGPIHFVGTWGLSAWLITTPDGHILMNTGMDGSGPMIEASIRKLGFRPEEIRILLACHAHIDHVGGHAYIQRLSGAKVWIIDSEKDLLESGGKLDFHYGASPGFRFEPVKADRVFRDGDTLRLGDVALTARLTPGHTRGATTWVMSVVEAGKAYTVVFPDGSGVNPGYRLVRDPSYPGIADDYRRTLQRLEMLRPDVWLAPHTEYFDFHGKRSRVASEGIRAWVDPEGYRKWVVRQRRRFEAAVNAETGSSAKSGPESHDARRDRNE